MTKPFDEPPLEIELDEMLARKASEIIRLADVLQRNRERRAMTQPHPVFPVGPDAA